MAKQGESQSKEIKTKDSEIITEGNKEIDLPKNGMKDYVDGYELKEDETLFKLGDKIKVIKKDTSIKVSNEKGQEEILKEEDIPEGWTFDLKKKSGIFIVDSYVIQTRIPTIGDKINIDSRRSIMTRGQYASMAISYITTTQLAVALTDAISLLNAVCTFPDNFPNGKNLAEADEEQEDLILKVYDGCLKWQKFFRLSLEKKSK